MTSLPRTTCFWSLLFIFNSLCLQSSPAYAEYGRVIKSSVYLSPIFVMSPGSVVNRYYRNIDFPRGHLGLKSFNAEVVDEDGVPVPLHETYLHHWVVARYYQHRNGAQVPGFSGDLQFQNSSYMMVRNSGICQRNVLGQYFGLGSETRRTATHVPDPYAIEIGNPDDIPDGYEERWLLNVHAIDTRGVEDKSGCTECKCNLYNVTKDEYGRPLRPGYEGGLYCCYDHTQCKVKEQLPSSSRGLYLRYTVQWIDWDEYVLPVKIYIFDVTDTWKGSKDSTDHNCQVEYEVMPCKSSDMADGRCIDSRKISLVMPRGGYLVYAVAHQHAGGIGLALYREDGRVICSSIPTYGKGKEAGNEAGYIVGMSTCYPPPGSVKLSDGDSLFLESNYSSAQKHTGVMGLFYMLVANELPKPRSHLHGSINVPISLSALCGLGVVMVVAVVLYHRRAKGDDGYRPM